MYYSDFDSTSQTAAVLPFDHIFPNLDIPAGQAPAVLYLARLSKSEGDLLSYLKDHASRTEDFRFIVRYRPDAGRDREAVRTPNSLKGYGVEMVLKRTDYLTIDDRQLDGSGAGKSIRTVSLDLDLTSPLSADQQHVFSVNSSSQDNESRYSGVFGQDPWADLAANPVRPTELTGEVVPKSLRNKVF
jgi:UDP-glucose:glycoprotein glucosyltransferase